MTLLPAVPCLLLAVAAAILGWRRPLLGLTTLIVLLPIHSGYIHLLENVLQLDSRVVMAAGAWKEGLLLGLVAGAVAAWRARRPTMGVEFVLALTLLALVAGRGAVDLFGGAPADRVLLGARALAEFAVVFLVVRLLAPGNDWLRRTARIAVPVLGVIALFAIIQPALGESFYNAFFHRPGEALPSAYTAGWGDLPRLRAVGTYEAPNELGLAMVIGLFALAIPLLLTDGRALIALSSGLLVAVLLLSLSRSAWVGAATATIVIVAIGWPLLRSNGRRLLSKVANPMTVALIAAPMLLALVVFVVSGGIDFVAATVGGDDPSANARPSSLRLGTAALFSHPLGLGLGTAGPKALESYPNAVQTENWYLLYGIQLGWLALAVLVALIATVLWKTGRAAHAAAKSPGDDIYPVLTQLGVVGSIAAAAVGAFVIPALLDLPVSIMLWTLVAMALPAADRRPAQSTAPIAANQPRVTSQR